MAGETEIDCFLIKGEILVDKTDKKGLPNGDTHAAYVKLPTSFSRFLTFIYVDSRALSTRLMYFFCFSTDNLQDLAMASY